MRKILGVSLVTVGLAIGLVATSASAAPFSGLSEPVAKTDGSAVEKVGCWWRHGHRYCSAPFISFGHRHRHYNHRYNHRRHHWRR